jgi:hypothetical protein
VVKKNILIFFLPSAREREEEKKPEKKMEKKQNRK